MEIKRKQIEVQKFKRPRNYKRLTKVLYLLGHKTFIEYVPTCHVKRVADFVRTEGNKGIYLPR